MLATQAPSSSRYFSMSACSRSREEPPGDRPNRRRSIVSSYQPGGFTVRACYSLEAARYVPEADCWGGTDLPHPYMLGMLLLDIRRRPCRRKAQTIVVLSPATLP